MLQVEVVRGMKLGFEIGTGKVVDVPVTHTVFSALTGGGKTEAVLRLMKEAAAQGYTILALDVKAKPRDFDGIGREIKPVISQSTEPLLVLRMLEAVAGYGLFSRFPVILDACADTKDLEEFRANLEALRDNKKAWARRREDAKVLAYFTKRLRDQVAKGSYSSELQLRPGINVMDISRLPEGVQQLVVDSVLRRLLEGHEKVILVLEEAIRFIPQAEKVQFDTSARRFIREGRSANLWLWASGQALTEMDVHVRKNIRLWILGPQSEVNEAKRFTEQVPLKVKAAEIQSLSTGHFIVGIRRADEEGGKVEVKKIYVQPTWLPDDVAVGIATERWTLKDAMKHKRRAKVLDIPEKEMEKGLSKLKEVKDTDEEERRRYEAKLDEQKKELQKVWGDNARLAEKVKELEQKLRGIGDPRSNLEPKLGEALGLPSDPPGSSTLGHPGLHPEDLETSWLQEQVDLRTRAIVREEISRIGPLGVREVPPPRAILQNLLQEQVERVKGKVAALNVQQKKMLAYLAAKGVALGYGEVVKAASGYDSGPGRTMLKALETTGLVTFDSKHSRIRYAGREVVKEQLGSTYDLVEKDHEEVLAAIENEFAHMISEEKTE